MTLSQPKSLFSSVALCLLLLPVAASSQAQGGKAPAAATASTPSAVRPIGEPTTQLPKHLTNGFDLPNGWRITPGRQGHSHRSGLVLNLVVSPMARSWWRATPATCPMASTSSIQDAEADSTHRTEEHLAGIDLVPDGHTLYVSGGNATGAKTIAHDRCSHLRIHLCEWPPEREADRAVVGDYRSQACVVVWRCLPAEQTLVYAANRGTGTGPSNVVVFDAKTRQIVTRIPVEINPYQTVLTPDGWRLFVSNWASQSVSVIDTATNKVIRTLHVGMNPTT